MDKRDKIYLKGMTFYGYHGLFNEEKNLGQSFIVDAILYSSMDQVGKTDDMADGVHYGEVFNLIKKIVQGPSYNLLEALVTQIAQSILQEFSTVEEVTITVHKPNAPIEGYFDSVAVERTVSR